MLQEFVQQVKDTVSEMMKDVHTAFPGKIVGIDLLTGLAVVQPALKYKKPNGQKIDFPQISGVPIVIPGGSKFSFPVNVGDGCLVIIAEQSIEEWLYGRETSSDLKFDLSNAICIPGLQTSSVLNVSSDVTIKNGNSTISLGASGAVTITAADITLAGNVTVRGEFTHIEPE